MTTGPAEDRSTGARRTRVAIMGTGFAGLAMAIRLEQAGVDDVVLLERSGAIGGTWRDNTYPGAACDIPSHLYSLAAHPKPDWTHLYARQPEIRDYLEDVACSHDIHGRTLFGADVTEAVFDDADATWTVRTRDGRTVVADILVSAVGGLKDPKIPNIPGLSDFAGPAFHSARWDHSVDLADARVGVVGTGASAIQIVPAIADTAERVSVFQRTPPWVVPRSDRTYSWATKRLFSRLPGLQRAYRRWLYLRHEATYPLVFDDRAPLAEPVMEAMRRWIHEEIDDPELADAVTPDYRIGCKRILKSADWYRTLTRDDVDLVTAGIDRIRPGGTVLEDGTRIDLDVLVLATGFTVDRPLGDMAVTGIDGRDLATTWGHRPVAHLGTMTSGFPNLFFLLGPNTGLGHNSVVLMVEAQVEWVIQALDHLERCEDLAWLDVRREVLDAFVAEIDEAHDGQAWASGCSSWYLGEDGVNFTVWPGSVTDYRRRLADLDPSIFEPSPARRVVGVPA